MSLFKKEALLIWLMVGFLFAKNLTAQIVPTYKEANGLVVVEIESAPDYGNWVLDTTILGFTGAAYLNYQGNNLFNDPGFSKLEFKVVIEKTGKYRFQWRSRIAEGTSNTEHNDSWLRMQDASDFYGEKGSERVYPRGTGKTPNPEGSSRNGWLKIYQNTRGEWTWQTRTSDNDPHQIFVEFDSVGTYTIEISGRSKGHAIDRFVLFHRDIRSIDAIKTSNPESERVATVSTRNIPFKSLTLRPTLANDVLFFDAPLARSGTNIEGHILNAIGQQVQSFSFPSSTNTEIKVPIAQLRKGTYFIQFQIDDFYYRGKFIKL